MLDSKVRKPTYNSENDSTVWKTSTKVQRLKIMKHLLSWIVPYGIWVKLRIWSFRRRKKSLAAKNKSVVIEANYESLIKDLTSEGCNEGQVREGSMPESSLKSVVTLLDQILPSGPLLGLHIGNFVGVSLTYLTTALVQRNAGSHMVSIDPNIPHRGINRPMEQVIRLLNRSGVQGNSLILTGYSLKKSISNDGVAYTSELDPTASFADELSCERQLEQLAVLVTEKFHLAVIDGNHDGGYLEQELAWLNKLLGSGALLVVDDVSEGWVEIQEVFGQLIAGGTYEGVFQDGRIGVLRKKI